MTLSSGPSRRSPNHINHRLTLGSSPAAPYPPHTPSTVQYFHTEFNAQVAPLNTNGGIKGCLDERGRLIVSGQDGVCFFLMLEKGLGLGKKRIALLLLTLGDYLSGEHG